MIIGALIQQPSDRLDYDVDYSDWFVGQSSDFIIGALATVDIEGLTVSTVIPPDDKQMVKLWIQDGEPNVTYQVELQISTNAGRIKEVEIEVTIEEF